VKQNLHKQAINELGFKAVAVHVSLLDHMSNKFGRKDHHYFKLVFADIILVMGK
jgi:hypothetical protein